MLIATFNIGKNHLEKYKKIVIFLLTRTHFYNLKEHSLEILVSKLF